MDRTSQLQPLGVQRLRTLDCLGGNTKLAPGYFAPAEGVDIFAAFREHVGALSRQWANVSDPASVALLAAARLLTGEIAAADAIIDHLPAAPIKLDHGAGVCRIVPYQALAAVLPLPRALADTRLWLAGSREQTALRAWLDAHREALRWHETDGVYRAVG
jgi:hypothetical protein